MLDQLISIYGRYQTTDEVKADAEFLELCEAHPDNELDPFHSQRKLVEKLSRQMDSSLKNQTARSQVRTTLRFYQKFVGSSTNSEEQIWLQLARVRHYPKWTEPQQEYFDQISTIIATKLDYFLSFTQRNQQGAGNPINGYHRYSIQYLGQLEDPIASSENKLAEMLDRYLKRHNLRGFYFPIHEDDSQQVLTKLHEALSRSLVFIQLVQNEMFSNVYPAAENYCFTEYTQAAEENKRILMLFANGAWPDDLIDDVDVPFDLDDWYQFVRGAALMFLEPTSFNDEYNKNGPLIKAKLKNPLLAQVKQARDALWENAPAD